MVTVVAIHSEHRVSTYLVTVVTEASAQPRHQRTPSQSEENRGAAPERRKSQAEPAKNSSAIEGRKIWFSLCSFHFLKTCLTCHVCFAEEKVLPPPVAHPTGIKLGDRQIERLRKAAEKAEQARAKIEKRKQEWAQL